MDKTSDIVETVLAVYPNTQAICLFGSYGTAVEWSDSDVDIALLLSFYQKLNEERREILEAFRESKRAYAV